MKKRIPLLSLAAVLVASFGLTGCSSDNNASGTPSAPETSAAQTATDEFNGKIPNPTHVVLEHQSSETPYALSGDIDTDAANPKGQFTLNADTADTENVILVDGTVYTKDSTTSGAWKKLGQYDPTSKSEVGAYEDPYRNLLSGALGDDETRPGSIQWALKNIKLTKAETETIEGTECTHWRGETDTYKAKADFCVDANGDDVQVNIENNDSRFGGISTWTFTNRGQAITVTAPM